MRHPSRRPPNPKLELLPEGTPLPPPGAPSWSRLPEPTRRALTRLVTRMLIAHVGAEAPVREDGDDDI
jgi:hypothetical protein